MTEQFANKIKTTLAADYTAGAGSIVVTDATGMPATGTFRLRLSNAEGTILICTARAGTTLTVSVEQDDGNASSGTEVRLIVTAGGLLQLKADAGGGGGGGFFGAFLGVPTFLDQSAWSWINQGTSSVDQTGGPVRCDAQSAGGTSIRLRIVTLPARPFTITAGFIPFFPPSTNLNNLALLGLGMYESATTKLVACVGANLDFTNGNALPGCIAVQAYNTPTGGTGTLFAQKKGGTDFPSMGINTLLPPMGKVYWLRVNDDNTNVTYSFSWDKQQWKTLVTQARTLGFTTAPDRLALAFSLQSGSVSPHTVGWVTDWEQA